MKQMRRIQVAFVAILMVAQCSMVGSAASQSDNDFVCLMENLYYTRNHPNISDINPPEGEVEGEMVTKYTWEEVEGIAVYCKDVSLLDGAVIGDFTLALADKATNNDVPIRSCEEMLTVLNQSNPTDDDYTITMELPAIYALHSENIYIICTQNSDLAVALEDQSLCTPIGVLTSWWYTYGGFYGAETDIYIMAEAWGFDTTALENFTEYELVSREKGNGDCLDVWVHYMRFADQNAEITLEEAIALCEELSAYPGVQYAWIAGQYLPNAEYYYTTTATIRGLYDYDLGDIVADGTVDTLDALAALKEYCYSLIGETRLTAEELVRADVNNDAVIDTLDAVLILQYYNQYTVMSNTDVTFEQLINGS